MMTVALIIALCGGGLYLILTAFEVFPEIAELGRIAFACGLLAFLLGGVK